MKKKTKSKGSRQSVADAKSQTTSDTEYTFETLPRTYTGLLDDVMMRYSANYAGQEFFSRMIAKELIFGGGLFINDGYLVNHPVAREFLANDDSILHYMLSTGFIRVLTRPG